MSLVLAKERLAEAFLSLARSLLLSEISTLSVCKYPPSVLRDEA